MIDVNNFHYMKIGLASPEKIRSWSYGEVKTRNNQLSYIETRKDGLFCERILDLQKTGNVVVVSTNVYATKAWSVTDVV